MAMPLAGGAVVHELSIAESVIEGVCERTGDARVARVFLRVGGDSCVAPHAIRFCFDLCAAGTAVEGAALEIEEVPGAELLVTAVELA
jgi:hydrogenase nickel incorporation protein HypA/HybF